MNLPKTKVFRKRFPQISLELLHIADYEKSAQNFIETYDTNLHAKLHSASRNLAMSCMDFSEQSLDILDLKC